MFLFLLPCSSYLESDVVEASVKVARARIALGRVAKAAGVAVETVNQLEKLGANAEIPKAPEHMPLGSNQLVRLGQHHTSPFEHQLARQPPRQRVGRQP